MKIKVLLKEANTDPFKTPVMQLPASTAQQFSKPEIEKLIAAKYGMKVVGDISVGETVYSDVYRVEPDDTASYPTKTLVMKLSANDTEYYPYERIRNIRDRMLSSQDEGDNKAAKFLPIVYLAESIEINSENPKYKSIIIMEPLIPFTSNLQDMPRMLSGDPSRSPKLLLSMLKDEEFIHRLISTIVPNVSDATSIENLIFTGKTPNSKPVDIDYADYIIKTKVNNGRMIRRIPEKPIEAYKSPNKLTDQERKKIQDWEIAYDKEGSEFLNIMAKIKSEIKRIGLIFMYVLGGQEGAAKFDGMIQSIQQSTPVAPKSGQNPFPQNKQTRPEEVVPGAANFNDALERLEQYGMTRKDLHGKNYMMRETGQIVISDPGLFQITTPIKESKNANYKI